MKIQNLILLAFFGVILFSCSGQRLSVEKIGVSERNGIFADSAETPAAPGYADLVITASIKSAKRGMKSNDPAGQQTGNYSLLLNIDGQAEVLLAEMRDESHLQRKQSESADGVRYTFHKRIRLQAGPHYVLAALPADGVAAEKEIVIVEGKENSLVIEPVYRKTRKKVGYKRSFAQGVSAIAFKLN